MESVNPRCIGSSWLKQSNEIVRGNDLKIRLQPKRSRCYRISGLRGIRQLDIDRIASFRTQIVDP